VNALPAQMTIDLVTVFSPRNDFIDAPLGADGLRRALIDMAADFGHHSVHCLTAGSYVTEAAPRPSDGFVGIGPPASGRPKLGDYIRSPEIRSRRAARARFTLSPPPAL